MRQRIILVGKAGSGKDYLAFQLAKLGFVKDLSFTTRPKREGEKEGVDYSYISEEDFFAMDEQDGFYETANFNSWYYGTGKRSWENSRVFIMTPSGVSKIKPEDRDSCLIVYLDIPEDIRRERIAKRSDADSVDRRIEADRLDFKNFTDYDLTVYNPYFEVDSILEKWKSGKITSKYEMIRHCMWFCQGQMIDTVKFQEYFTPGAIRNLLDEGFIKLHMN